MQGQLVELVERSNQNQSGVCEESPSEVVTVCGFSTLDYRRDMRWLAGRITESLSGDRRLVVVERSAFAQHRRQWIFFQRRGLELAMFDMMGVINDPDSLSGIAFCILRQTVPRRTITQQGSRMMGDHDQGTAPIIHEDKLFAARRRIDPLLRKLLASLG